MTAAVPDMSWLDALRDFGLPTVLLFAFVYMAWKALKPMIDRLAAGHLKFLEEVAGSIKTMSGTMLSIMNVLSQMEKRLENIEVRLENIEVRLENIEEKVDK